MASDGLWDVMNNNTVFNFINEAMRGKERGNANEPSNEDFYQLLAKNLVSEARGQRVESECYWEKSNGDLASGDDISCITMNIKDVSDMLPGVMFDNYSLNSDYAN